MTTVNEGGRRETKKTILGTHFEEREKTFRNLTGIDRLSKDQSIGHFEGGLFIH